MPIETEPLSAAFGVDVRGVDLHADPEPVADELRALLGEHQLLRFRAPDLSADEQIRLLAGFGPVLDESRDGSGWTYVSNVEDGGVLGAWAFLFHSDLEFTDDPVRVLSLAAIELPEAPTSTRFASAVRAASLVDADLRSQITGRTALHVYPLLEARGDERYRLSEVDDGAARAEHPVLMTHPVTGAEILYTSAMQTDSIVGLPEAESEALLERGWALLYAPDNVYEHWWQPGDLLVWDNLALHHARDAVSGRRTLRRVPVGNVLARLRTNP
ncbi:MAG: TauD/TfdA family dioxygenase [Acidimicrobiia bacterium]|jgi:taurine dioxygenase